MATVKTSIGIQDNMTSVIKNVTAALGATINAFEGLESVSSNAISMKSLDSAKVSLARLNNDITSMENGLMQSDGAQKNLNNSISQGSSDMSGLLKSVTGVVGAYLSLQGLKDAMNIADSVATSNSRLAMMNDGLQTTKELQDMIYNSAQRSLAPYQDTVDIVAALGNRAGDVFANNQETILFAENLSKMFSIAGASQQEMASASLQLTQALGSGVLRGEELNAVFEAAPNIIQTIAKELDVGIGQIREMASDGQITAGVVKKAMLGATDEINAKFATMPTTFGDVFTLFRNQALKAFDPVLQKMTAISSSTEFMSLFNGIAASLNIVASAASWVIDVMVSGANFITDNWNIIGPIVIGLGIAIGGLTTSFLLAKAAMVVVTAAQWALNAAMMANPVGIVIVAVALLVTVLYLAVNALNAVAGTSISATGVVAAVFNGLFTFLYNNIAGIWNTFAALAEFVMNVFTNPVYSVKRLFYNLMENSINMAQGMIGSFDSAATNLANLFVGAANTAIGAINGVIDVLNAIPGIEIGKIGKLSARASVSADLTGLKTRLSNWVGDAPLEYRSVGKMDFKSLPDAFVNGYNGGSNFASNIADGIKVPDLFGGVEDILKSIDSGIGDIAEDGKGTKGNTKKMADKAGVLAEDLAYMRDLSDRAAINRYTTASIQVDMSNQLTVTENADVDGIVNTLAERIEEATQNLALGGNA